MSTETAQERIWGNEVHLHQPQATQREGHGWGRDWLWPGRDWLEGAKGSSKNEHSLLVKPAFLVSLSLGPVETESRSVRSTLCDPMDYTVHEILQARILEQVAIPFSRGSSRPRDPTQVSLPHCRRILYQLSYQESPLPSYWSKDLWHLPQK